MPDAKPTLTPSPSPAPLTAAQQARRDRIVDAGLTLLAERAYDKIQVKDVAEEANVALGTLYHYFSSKEHLFAEVLVRWAATLRTNISRNPLRGLDDAQRLTQVIRRSVRAFQRQPSLARLIATLETSADPYATEILARLAQTTTDIYVEAIHDVDRDAAERIVRVVDAVLAARLRAWVAGRITITTVTEDLADAIALLLDPTLAAAPRV
ncbi:MAG: TetR/AcrR family transcriptional regulator, cholesterol catabolism regulator [Actinomycetota bacterium]|jgi:AcrR family transcriptional regulator|nr:TetR/AcrR family transcriptional regulator, cholesterol catabolism regulator [Actinomycetota bacterium]